MSSCCDLKCPDNKLKIDKRGCTNGETCLDRLKMLHQSRVLGKYFYVLHTEKHIPHISLIFPNGYKKGKALSF